MKLKHLYAAIAAVALSGSVSAAEIDFFKLEHRVSAASAPTVYFTSDISPQGLMATYEALGRVPSGKVACKLSTGEGGNPNHLAAALIGGASIVGTTIGLAAALYSGRVARAFTTVVNVLMAFPQQLAVILLVGMLGVGLTHSILALALFWWVRFAQLCYNRARVILQKKYIQTAMSFRSACANAWRWR